MKFDFTIDVYCKNGLTVQAIVIFDSDSGIDLTINVVYLDTKIRVLHEWYDFRTYSPDLLQDIRFHYATFAWKFDNDREHHFPYLRTIPREDRNDVDDMDYCIYEWSKQLVYPVDHLMDCSDGMDCN